MDREDQKPGNENELTQKTSDTRDALRAMQSSQAELPSPDTEQAAPPSLDAWGASPWDFLGEQSSATTPSDSSLELPAPTPGISNEELSEAEREKLEEEARMQAYVEHKEAITESGLSVTLDKAAIAKIIDTIPIEEMVQSHYLAKPEEVNALIEERRADISRTVEAISRLPETISFKPGITLIVGENGLGKSTLAKALRYAGIIHDYAMREGNMEDAADLTLNPSSAIVDEKTELYGAGLAPDIARHIRVDYYGHMPYTTPHYYDASEIIGRQKTLDIQAGRTDYRYDELGQSRQYVGTHSRTGRSHRQTVDDQLFGYLKSEKESDIERKSRRSAREDGKKYPINLDTTGPQVYFIDEPETGMSPKRHKHLAEEVLDVTHEGATIILPTNSTVLYDSDLPRIDLEHPERGIFRPSEYPEDLN